MYVILPESNGWFPMVLDVEYINTSRKCAQTLVEDLDTSLSHICVLHDGGQPRELFYYSSVI